MRGFASKGEPLLILLPATLLLGIILGIGGTLAIGLIHPGPDSGDWLAFCGVILGIFLTVYSAVIIENHKRNSDINKKRNFIPFRISDLQEKFNSASNPRGKIEITEARINRIENAKELSSSIELFLYAENL